MARTRPAGPSTKPGAAPSASRPLGRVECIEAGDGFLVATGWAAERDGAPVKGELALEVGGEVHPVVGLFPRDDLAAGGLSAGPCAFRLDVPWSGPLPADVSVRLLVDGEPIWSSHRDAVPHRSFVPLASFDEAAAGLVSGWVFDPGLWHGRGDRVRLAVNEVELPVSVDRRRTDLPFSAAREGRFLGFRVALAAELEERHGRDVLGALAGEARLALASGDVPLATATVQFRHPDEPDGFIDFHAVSHGLDGWLFGGWVRNDAAGHGVPAEALVDLPDGSQATALLATYPRGDIEAIGRGLLAFVPGAGAQAEGVLTLRMGDEHRLVLRRSATTRPLGELEAVRMVRAIVRALPAGRNGAEAFARAVFRPVYEGVDTLAASGHPVLFEADELVRGGADGVLLKGWLLDPTGAVAAIRVRSGPLLSAPLGERWLTVDRPDIRDAHGARLGLEGAGFGFHAWAALPGLDPGRLHAELTLTTGEMLFKPLPPAGRPGRAGISRILSDVAVRSDNVSHVCGRVLGPPVIGINRERLALRGVPAVMALGALAARPRVSVVVPLYGRLDFMMYQMALLSEKGLPADELVYVLDQPERRAEFLDLARSCHRRFAIPARLVLPPENLGFAGASNAGLAAGAGEYVCFLNSDVVPADGDWLDRLVAAMEADPGIGVLGAQLLFEDGTLQHGGMAMKRLPAYGNMPFPFHPGKGRLPAPGGGVRDVPLVTGALMLMRRDVAAGLGGFDTDYVTGDFEDADLCMKVRGQGLRCAVHDGVRLFHLERQSQGSAAQAWRQNLTLVNACTFAARWDGRLSDVPVEDEIEVLA